MAMPLLNRELRNRVAYHESQQIALLCATSVFSVSLWLTEFAAKLTTETQRTQRLHREGVRQENQATCSDTIRLSKNDRCRAKFQSAAEYPARVHTKVLGSAIVPIIALALTALAPIAVLSQHKRRGQAAKQQQQRGTGTDKYSMSGK